MKRHMTILALGVVSQFLTINANGQYEATPTTGYDYMLTRLATINSSTTPIPGVPLPKPTLKGSSFLQENFSLTTFLLDGDVKPESGFAKYDGVFDEFLIMKGKEFKRLSGKLVMSFSWIDSISFKEHQYVRGKYFEQNDTFEPDVFVEVIAEGEMPLLKVINIIIKDPNYNIALDVGRRDYQIFKKEIYFVLLDGRVNELPPPRQIPTMFGRLTPFMEKFIELNDLDLRNEDHLAAVFDIYNERSQ